MMTCDSFLSLQELKIYPQILAVSSQDPIRQMTQWRLFPICSLSSLCKTHILFLTNSGSSPNNHFQPAAPGCFCFHKCQSGQAVSPTCNSSFPSQPMKAPLTKFGVKKISLSFGDLGMRTLVLISVISGCHFCQQKFLGHFSINVSFLLLYQPIYNLKSVWWNPWILGVGFSDIF